MRRESRHTRGQFAQVRQRTSKEQRFEAPIGGWNTRDAIDDIPPTDAIIMDNWIPDIGAVRVRDGFSEHCDTGIGGEVQSLFEYHDIDESSRKMFASLGGEIVDVSSSTPTVMDVPGDPRVGSIYDVAMIESESAEITAPQMWVNGVDLPVMFDGVKFRAASPDPSAEPDPDDYYLEFNFQPYFVGGASPPPSAASGFVGVTTFKNRLYYWMDGDQNFWYTELYAPSGKVTQFPLGATGNYGGKLVAIETWTKDGGSGPDDFIVFFMASGEAIVYQGSSPEDNYNWSIVGRYDIGEPINKRAIKKYGGDIVLVTTFGYIFMSQLLQGVEAFSKKNKIDGAARDALRNSNTTFGWEIITFPREKLLIFNVPSSGGYVQHVMNQVTGAWCRFTGYEAITLCGYRNNLYFGSTDGKIYQALDGISDNGEAILSDVQQAWLRPGGTQPKTFVAFKEQYRSTREIQSFDEYGVDYETIESSQYPTPIPDDLIYWTDEDIVASQDEDVPQWIPPPPEGAGDLPNGTPVGPPTLHTYNPYLYDPVTWWTNENYEGPDPPPQNQVTNWPYLKSVVHGEWVFIQGHGSVLSRRKKMATLQFYEMLACRVLYEDSGRL